MAQSTGNYVLSTNSHLVLAIEALQGQLVAKKHEGCIALQKEMPIPVAGDFGNISRKKSDPFSMDISFEQAFKETKCAWRVPAADAC